jgi:hypothetical protein
LQQASGPCFTTDKEDQAAGDVRVKPLTEEQSRALAIYEERYRTGRRADFSGVELKTHRELYRMGFIRKNGIRYCITQAGINACHRDQLGE